MLQGWVFMSQFDDPGGAMPPPDENDPAPGSSPNPPSGPFGAGEQAPGPLQPDAGVRPQGSGSPSLGSTQGSAPIGTQGLVPEPQLSLEKRVVIYWIVSGLLSWAVLSAFLGGAAGFVYVQASGGGEDALGWTQAWSFVMPAAVSLSGLLLAWNLVSPPLAYSRWRYSIDTELLLARYGILFIEEKAIPISRLQHVDLYRGFLERMFGLTTLIVFTAGTEGAHFRLPGLSLGRARELRDLILAARGDDVI